MGTGEQSFPKLRKPTERPCYKLSADLLKTYKGINDLFYEQKRKKQEALQAKAPSSQSQGAGVDDDQGNYVVNVGDEIGGRYLVQEGLGKGSFGVVVKALDQKRDECVAVKVIKNKAQFFQQAKVEIDILTKLNAQAAEDHNIVKLKKVFTWKDHLCLVFELLSFNLYDLLKYTKFNGISLNLIRKFAVQILKTLEFLASPTVGIVHCDLKPENILLKNPKRSGIKVIDFGSSCYLTKKMFKYIQSRFYRSPEVILGLPYDCAIDMWSLGCVLVEMHTGSPVFDGKDEAEQLLKMASILGPQPQRMIEQSPKKRNFYQWDPKQKRWLLEPPGRDPGHYPHKTLEEVVGVSTGGPGGRRKGQAGHMETDYQQFVDFVRGMFHYTAPLRTTASAALQHPFLASVLGDINAAASPQAAPPIPRMPSSPSCTSVSRQAGEPELRAPQHLACTASYSSQDSKWRAHSARESGAPSASDLVLTPKASIQERRASLPASAASQATHGYRHLVESEPEAPAPPDDTPVAITTRTLTMPMANALGSPTSLPRTRSVPHVAAVSPSSGGRRAVGSPTDAANDSLLRVREYQTVTLGSPLSPSTPFSPGSLRLKPKLPGGTGQSDSLTILSPQTMSAARSMSLLGSPAARAVLYADSPNSGKYAPGAPITPRTHGGGELRQYIATHGPLGSPQPAADGRKWLPSPMMADGAGGSRKFCADSPCSADPTRPDDATEVRPVRLNGSWKGYPEISYARHSTSSLHHPHHGGAEPMLRAGERDHP